MELIARWASVQGCCLSLFVPPATRPSAISEGENLLTTQLAIYSSVGGVDPALRRRDARPLNGGLMALKRDVSFLTTRFQDAKACEMSILDWVHLQLWCSVAPVKMASLVSLVLDNDSF